MPPKGRLSREEKGKDVDVTSSPAKNVTANGSPLEDFDLMHRDAMRDTANMDLSQRLLVVDAHRAFREARADLVTSERIDESGSSRAGSGSDRESAEDSESDRTSGDSESSNPSPQALWERHRFLRFDLIDCRPTVYHPGGIFEELPALPPRLL